MAIDEAKLQALWWCRSALAEAHRRCVQTRDDALLTWTAAVEGVWWLRSLDEALEAQFGQPYKDARNGNPDGQVVDGFRWIRNRHLHEIVITGVGGPKKPFFPQSPDDRYMFYISPPNVWLPSADIRAENDRSPKLKPSHDAHVAGLPIDHSLERCLSWFDTAFTAFDVPDLPAPDDPTVLKV